MVTIVARRKSPPTRDLSRWAPWLVALEYLGNFLRAVYHYRQVADLDHLNADAISVIKRLTRNQ